MRNVEAHDTRFGNDEGLDGFITFLPASQLRINILIALSHLLLNRLNKSKKPPSEGRLISWITFFCEDSPQRRTPTDDSTASAPIQTGGAIQDLFELLIAHNATTWNERLRYAFVYQHDKQADVEY